MHVCFPDWELRQELEFFTPDDPDSLRQPAWHELSLRYGVLEEDWDAVVMAWGRFLQEAAWESHLQERFGGGGRLMALGQMDCCDYAEPPMPRSPTTYLPGDPRKVQVLQRRYERGYGLWHPNDPEAVRDDRNGWVRQKRVMVQ